MYIRRAELPNHVGFGKGPSTASQTGWALLALVAAGSRDYERAIRRGIGFVVGSILLMILWEGTGTWVF